MGPIARLTQELGKLPGIGPKTAERLTHHLLAAGRPDVLALADALRAVKEEVRFCAVCCNPTTEGDGTALYLASLLAPLGVKVTRLARGLPSGSALELANNQMLVDALEGRRAF